MKRVCPVALALALPSLQVVSWISITDKMTIYDSNVFCLMQLSDIPKRQIHAPMPLTSHIHTPKASQCILSYLGALVVSWRLGPAVLL